MSIIIKGAKMPKECEYCMFAGFGGAAHEYYVCMFNGKWKGRYSHGRMESCPLIEIPPHGRLIDASEMAIKLSCLDLDITTIKNLHELLMEMPTVVESEEDK